MAPGIRVVIATTCYWNLPGEPAVEDDRPTSACVRGVIMLGRSPGEPERFSAQLLNERLGGGESEDLYEGDALAEALAALNSHLDSLEDEGATRSDRNDLPSRVSAEDAEDGIDRTRQMIEEHLASLPPQPPEPVEVVRCRAEELRDAQVLLTIGRGSLSLGALSGRPVLFTTDSAITNWVQADHLKMEDGEAVAWVFASPEDRWMHIIRRDWDRYRPEYLREEIRAQYWMLSNGRGSEDDFEDAYRDATKAIRSLPCEGCGHISWPVVAKPEQGSAAWWDDPGEYFACRNCGRFLASGFAYPFIRRTTSEYPFVGRVPPPEEREAEYRMASRAAGRSGTDSPGRTR